MTTKTALTPFSDAIDPKIAKAIQALRTSTIPKEQISEHPGKGGKKFKYVKHTHATMLMNDAFQQGWNWEVVSYEVFQDTSACVLGRMTLNLPYDDNGTMKIHQRIIQEVGNFQPIGGGMNSAASVSSAASRSLLKCMFRAFGFGKELYPDKDEEVTPKAAWNMLLQQAKRFKIEGPELMAMFRAKELIQQAKLTEEDKVVFVDKFEELWKAISEYIDEKKGKSENVPS
jgi:hypothetical protein